jgi:hypothetical protein
LQTTPPPSPPPIPQPQHAQRRPYASHTRRAILASAATGDADGVDDSDPLEQLYLLLAPEFSNPADSNYALHRNKLFVVLDELLHYEPRRHHGAVATGKTIHTALRQSLSDVEFDYVDWFRRREEDLPELLKIVKDNANAVAREIRPLRSLVSVLTRVEIVEVYHSPRSYSLHSLRFLTDNQFVLHPQDESLSSHLAHLGDSDRRAAALEEQLDLLQRQNSKLEAQLAKAKAAPQARTVDRLQRNIFAMRSKVKILQQKQRRSQQSRGAVQQLARAEAELVTAKAELHLAKRREKFSSSTAIKPLRPLRKEVEELGPRAMRNLMKRLSWTLKRVLEPLQLELVVMTLKPLDSNELMHINNLALVAAQCRRDVASGADIGALPASLCADASMRRHVRQADDSVRDALERMVADLNELTARKAAADAARELAEAPAQDAADDAEQKAAADEKLEDLRRLRASLQDRSDAEKEAAQAEFEEQREDEEDRIRARVWQMMSTADRKNISTRSQHAMSMLSREANRRAWKEEGGGGLPPYWRVRLAVKQLNEEMARELPMHVLPHGAGYYFKLKYVHTRATCFHSFCIQCSHTTRSLARSFAPFVFIHLIFGATATSWRLPRSAACRSTTRTS